MSLRNINNYLQAYSCNRLL